MLHKLLKLAQELLIVVVLKEINYFYGEYVDQIQL
jgi:hypothetical protein